MDKTWEELLKNAKELREQAFKEQRVLYGAEQKRYDDLIKELQKPKDISKITLEEQAGIITLSFIGYFARPTGISKGLLEKCARAFNNNRGKVEREIDAVLKVLKEANNVK